MTAVRGAGTEECLPHTLVAIVTAMGAWILLKKSFVAGPWVTVKGNVSDGLHGVGIVFVIAISIPNKT